VKFEVSDEGIWSLAFADEFIHGDAKLHGSRSIINGTLSCSDEMHYKQLHHDSAVAKH
jgi:hypothetical protein